MIQNGPKMDQNYPKWPKYDARIYTLFRNFSYWKSGSANFFAFRMYAAIVSAIAGGILLIVSAICQANFWKNMTRISSPLQKLTHTRLQSVSVTCVNNFSHILPWAPAPSLWALNNFEYSSQIWISASTATCGLSPEWKWNCSKLYSASFLNIHIF